MASSSWDPDTDTDAWVEGPTAQTIQASRPSDSSWVIERAQDEYPSEDINTAVKK